MEKKRQYVHHNIFTHGFPMYGSLKTGFQLYFVSFIKIVFHVYKNMTNK